IDVGARRDPAADRSARVPNRQRVNEKPAIAAVGAFANAIFERQRLTGTQGLLPVRSNGGAVVGMNRAQPTRALRLGEIEAGELRPAVVDVIHLAAAVGCPDQLWKRVGQQAVTLLTLG